MKAKTYKEREEPSKEPNNMPSTNKEPNVVIEEKASPNAPNEETSHEPWQGYKFKSYHPSDNLLTDISTSIRNRSSLRNFCAFSSFVSLIEPKNYLEALEDPSWVIAMQEELSQFERNQVWFLIFRPKDLHVIGTKWVSE